MSPNPLAEAIRRTSNVPIIFITGFHDDFTHRLSLVPNVTTLQKPFDSRHLIDLITVTLTENAASARSVSTMLENP